MFPIERAYRTRTDIVLMQGTFVIGAGCGPSTRFFYEMVFLAPLLGSPRLGFGCFRSLFCPDAMSPTRLVSGSRLGQQAYVSRSPSRRQLGWRGAREIKIVRGMKNSSHATW